MRPRKPEIRPTCHGRLRPLAQRPGSCRQAPAAVAPNRQPVEPEPSSPGRVRGFAQRPEGLELTLLTSPRIT
jgi:hypothetical protein